MVGGDFVCVLGNEHIDLQKWWPYVLMLFVLMMIDNSAYKDIPIERIGMLEWR